MSFNTKCASGYAGSSVAFVSSDEFAWICGNTLVLHSVFSGAQRLLQGPGCGIQCFAANPHHELIALVEKGVRPSVHVYSSQDLTELAVLKSQAELGYTAVCFSGNGERLALCSDEPDSSVEVYIWREAHQLVHAQIPKPVRQVSFHPYDADRLCTTGLGEQTVWKIVKLWQKYDFVPEHVRLQGYEPTCHAWYPQGLYCGTSTGEVFAIDPLSLQPFTFSTEDGGEVPMMVQATSSRQPITCLTINRECLIVGSPEPHMTWYAHATKQATFHLVNELQLGAVGVSAIDAGGQGYSKVVIGTLDPRLVCAEIIIDGENFGFSLQTVADCHMGVVVGVVPHPGGGYMLTAGSDGSLRVWETEDELKLFSKRTFSSAQTAIASCGNKLLVALGSETGVIRLISLDDLEHLPVLHRSRVHTAAITNITFSAKGNMLLSVARDMSLCFMSLTGRQHHLSVIGYTAAPEPVLSVCWPPLTSGDDNVLISLSSGGIMSITAPMHLMPGYIDDATASALQLADYQLSVRDLQVRTIKLEMPMLKVVGLTGEKFGVVYGMGADKQLHQIQLPAEGAAWAGLKGRLHKSSLRVAGHGKPDGCMAACPSGLLLASCSHDGSVGLRNDKLQVEGARFDLLVHDLMTGGATGVAFDASGAHFMSVGADGSMFLFAAHSYGERHLTSPPPLEPYGATTHDLDDLDDVNELTVVEMVKKRASNITSSSGMSFYSNPAEARAKLGLLRRQLNEALIMNDHAPEEERLQRNDFIIDDMLVAELKAAADQRIQAVQQEVRREMMKMALVCERTQQHCVDAMAERGAAILSLRTNTLVNNFPTAPPDYNHLTKVAFLRRVEILEQKALHWVDGSHAYRIKVDESGSAADPAGVSADQVGETPGNDLEAVINFEVGSSDVDVLMYSDFDVYAPTRKVVQIQLMRHKINQVREAFNAEFARTRKLKKAEVDKIMDLQARLQEIDAELEKLGGSTLSLRPEDKFVVRTHPEEDLEEALKVQDDEVTVEKVLTEEERIKHEEQQRAEEAAMRRSQNDNTGERALKAMMGGTLQAKSTVESEFSLVKPAWMDQNPKDFTDEQRKELKEFQAKEKALQEEKAKKRNKLEMELRSMRAHLEEAITKFDELVAALHAKRLRAVGDIRAMESRMIGLACNIEKFQQVNDKAEKALIMKLTHVKELRGQVSNQLQEFSAMVVDRQEKIAQLSADDKQLDKNFKKEFADCDYFYNRLVHLYRYRAQTPQLPHRISHMEGGDGSKRESLLGAVPPSESAGEHSGGEAPHKISEAGELLHVGDALEPWPKLKMSQGSGGNAGEDERELLPPDLKPEGLPDQWWDKFVEYRASKVRTEQELQRELPALVSLKNQVAKLEKLEAQYAEQVDSLMKEMTSMRGARKYALFNVETQLRLKQGQVETEPAIMSSDLSHAVFIHRSIVEGVNNVVRHKGGKKVDILTAIKDFKKGIYGLQWSCTRLDMLAQDLGDKTRQLQLLHVTKDFQQLLKTGEEKSSNPQEASNLESLLRARELLHMKNIEERQRRLHKMNAEIRLKGQQNEEVKVHLVALQKVLEDQSRIQASMQTVDEQTTRRMRSLVTHKKLKEIARQQLDEIARIKKEIDDLHLKTFPSFVENHTLLPDARFR